MSEKTKYTVAVDFDGVLHSYTSPWVNAWTIPDPPVEGAIEWLRAITLHFNVVIFSTRCKSWRGRRAMRRWIWEHDTGKKIPQSMWEDNLNGVDRLAEIKFTKAKPPCLIYLDDRAVRFEGPGTFPSRDEIHRLRPWNKGTKR